MQCDRCGKTCARFVDDEGRAYHSVREVFEEVTRLREALREIGFLTIHCSHGKKVRRVLEALEGTTISGVGTDARDQR